MLAATTRDTLDTLETCLDPEAMRTRLQAVLPNGLVIDRVRVLSARRNASRMRNPNPLTLRYELDVHDHATGAPAARQYYGKAYRNGASAIAASCTPALHLVPLDMLLWPWPADPGLPQLPALLDPNQTLRWWNQPARAVSTLRYQPEQRATLCYTRNTPGREPERLYAKTFGDERGEAIYRRFAYFWTLAAQDTAAPTVAQPLGYSVDTRAFWQAQAAGVPWPRARASMAPDVLAERTARALATLHAAPLSLAGAQPRDTAHWLTEVRRRCKKIVRAVPALAERAACVADAIEQAVPRLSPVAPTLIHGDCHPDQMWLGGGRIVLFDFDEFTLGDAMEDLAAFVIRLGAGEGNAAFTDALLAAYQRIAPQRFSRARLHWHLAIQQLLQASRAFVFQVSDWRGEVERRLARAQSRCACLNTRIAA